MSRRFGTVLVVGFGIANGIAIFGPEFVKQQREKEAKERGISVLELETQETAKAGISNEASQLTSSDPAKVSIGKEDTVQKASTNPVSVAVPTPASQPEVRGR